MITYTSDAGTIGITACPKAIAVSGQSFLDLARSFTYLVVMNAHYKTGNKADYLIRELLEFWSNEGIREFSILPDPLGKYFSIELQNQSVFKIHCDVS